MCLVCIVWFVEVRFFYCFLASVLYTFFYFVVFIVLHVAYVDVHLCIFTLFVNACCEPHPLYCKPFCVTYNGYVSASTT